jgi:hypothetical protein
LLEALVKRQNQCSAGGGGTAEFLPLAMRPDLELANSFSTYRNERIDHSACPTAFALATGAP